MIPAVVSCAALGLALLPTLAGAAARVTQPTYEKLKAQLATLDKKIATASKALQDHKDIMMRSRYTPEGLKLATAKLKTLEKDLAKLQTQRKQLVAQMAVIRPSSKPPTAAALTASVERHLKAGDLQFGAKAPKKEDILTQTSVHKHPFSYTAIQPSTATLSLQRTGLSHTGQAEGITHGA